MSRMESLLPKLKNEMLEISIGDDYEEVNQSDSTQIVNGVIYGKLLDIVEDFLVLDCLYIDRSNNQAKFGNIIYINSWHIKAFTMLKSNGSLSDVMLSAAHSRKIKELLGWKDE